MSVTKIGRIPSSVFPFSVVNWFGYNFGSSNIDSINLKKDKFSCLFTYDFDSKGRITKRTGQHGQDIEVHEYGY